jgi:hypothetical protein
VGNLRERDHLEDTGEDERNILNGFSRSGMGTWTGIFCITAERFGGFL